MSLESSSECKPNTSINAELRNERVQNIKLMTASVEEKLGEAASLVKDATSFLKPLASSSPWSKSQVDLQELKMHLNEQDQRPSRSDPRITPDRPACYDRVEDPGEKTSKEPASNPAVDTAKEINIYHSGGLLLMQNYSQSQTKVVSDVSAKLIEEYQKLSDGLKEIEGNSESCQKPGERLTELERKSEGSQKLNESLTDVDGKNEGKIVQFDLSLTESLDEKRAPGKDDNGSWSSGRNMRASEQPSSLSTNESLPWQPVGPSSPSSTASARRLEWDSAADIGYLDVDMTKQKLSTIERVTLQGLKLQGTGEKKVVYKTNRGNRILERIPSDVIETEEKKPTLKDSGTNPETDRGAAIISSESVGATSGAQAIVHEVKTNLKSDTSQSSDQVRTSSPDFKDESTFVNTLGEEFDFPKTNRNKSSPNRSKKKSSPKSKIRKSGKIREIIDTFNESDRKLEELFVDHSFKGEFITQNTGKNAVTSASSGSNITVLRDPRERNTQHKDVQTSHRASESKGVQAVSPQILTSCKCVQASGELNSLPKHLDARKMRGMSGQEVRTKSTQFFGAEASSLPKALTKGNRINKELGDILVSVEQVKVKKSTKSNVKPAVLAGPSELKIIDEQERINKSSVSQTPGNCSKQSERKNDSPLGKSGELTVDSLRQKDHSLDSTLITKKFFDSQPMTDKSTSMNSERNTAPRRQHMVSIGIQYSPKNDTLGNNEAANEQWMDTLDSQASSTKTANSWVLEGVPRRNSVVRPTRSFEYLPGEVYESSGNLRETLPSETSQNVITESSSSESDPPRRNHRPSDSEGAALHGSPLCENQHQSRDIGVAIEHSPVDGLCLEVMASGVGVSVSCEPSVGVPGVSERSQVSEDVSTDFYSIAVQTEHDSGRKKASRGDDTLKRTVRAVCEILMNERRPTRNEIRSLDRKTLPLSSKHVEFRAQNARYAFKKPTDSSRFKQQIPSSDEKSESDCNENTLAAQKIKEDVKSSLDGHKLEDQLKNGKVSEKQHSTGKENSNLHELRKTVMSPEEESVLESIPSSERKESFSGISEFSDAQKSAKSADIKVKESEKAPSSKKVCLCHSKGLKIHSKQPGGGGSKKISSNDRPQTSTRLSRRACSTPNIVSSLEGSKATTDSTTPVSNSEETSESNRRSESRSLTSENSGSIRSSGNKAFLKLPHKTVKSRGEQINRATQVSADDRISEKSPNLTDKSTQLNVNSLGNCRKCHSKSCTCLQVDVGTQMSSKVKLCLCSKKKCYCKSDSESTSSHKDSFLVCSKCGKESCTCISPMAPEQIERGTQTANAPGCCYCEQNECRCQSDGALPSTGGTTSSKLKSCQRCRKCGSESCTCLNLVSPGNEGSRTSPRCSRCSQYGCSCTKKSPAVESSKTRGTTVIDAFHFDDVDLSSRKHSSLSSGAECSPKDNSQDSKEDNCSICLCSDGIKQQCIFCPCHIDKKNTHIPRCDCHVQSVPKFLLPGFCKCHRRNLEFFNECLCSAAPTGSNCPCCETFYGHMRKMVYEKQMKENAPKTKKMMPKNYFLKLEETDVSKDSSDVSEPEKKHVEVVTIKIPVKRCGKAKLASKNFYYAGSSHPTSAKSDDVEYLNDIIKKYTTEMTSQETSEKSSDKRKSGATVTASSYRTVQEFLESNRPDFLNTAEYRRNIMRERMKERKAIKESKFYCPVQPAPCPLPAKIFTTAQIKQQTLRKYKQLREVREKKENWKKNEEHKRNKLMADIFAKKLQLKTLQGQTIREYEDCSCHIRAENGTTYLYGIFDGNDGIQAAHFALQRMAAEILLLSDLTDKNSDEEVKEVLRQAFIAVEKSYWDSLDDKLAVRTSVQCEIPEGLTPFEQYQKYPHLVEKLKSLNMELQCGTTAVVALIHLNKLYVANVGDSRALLCKTDSDGVLKVVQLSVDHDLRNEDEQLRISNLGLHIDKIRQVSRIGNQECTRCIGNYLVKGGYKDMEELANARSEPVIAEPDIHGGIPLDKSCRFLLLMSDGLYKSLQVATGFPDHVNKDIAQMTVEQFREQSTLTGVAQAVVDKVGRQHHDLYMADGTPQCRDDITLIVRNFNYPMDKAMTSPINPAGSQVRFNPIVSTAPIDRRDEVNGESDAVSTGGDARSAEDTTTTTTSESSDVFSNPVPGQVRRIDPYVDFSQFYRNVEVARQNGTLPNCLR